MSFENEKKTFLAKLDKSKKGRVDSKVLSLVDAINIKKDYYTTSSCSGRVVLWKGSGKKNEMEWLKVSHDIIDEHFLDIDDSGLVWLRLEPFIMHIACRDMEAANKLLEIARGIYKKSCILSASNKIIVEIKGSEFIEMPLYEDGKLFFSGDLVWLQDMINSKLEKIWLRIEKLEKVIKNL